MAPGRAGSEVRTGFRRQPHTLAHNLAHNLAALLRSIGPPEAMADRSMTSLWLRPVDDQPPAQAGGSGWRLRLVKIAAGVVHDTRAITFQLAEVAVNGFKHLVDSLGNSPIQRQRYGGGNRSTRPAGAPNSPNHEPSAEMQQLEELQ